MGFNAENNKDATNKDQAAGQERGERQERQERGNRRDRSERQDRPERKEEKEVMEFAGSSRNGRFRTVGEAGRADIFLKTYIEAMKDEGEL